MSDHTFISKTDQPGVQRRVPVLFAYFTHHYSCSLTEALDLKIIFVLLNGL